MTYINDTNTLPGQVRAPRGMVKLMGTDGLQPAPVAGWIDWEVDSNAHYSADTFHVTFAVRGLSLGYDILWMSEQQFIQVEILAGFPADPSHYDASELTSLIIGRVDNFKYDPLQNTVTLAGRDNSSVLIDTKTTNDYRNKTTAQAVQMIAAAHGMTANVGAAPESVGTFMGDEKARVTTNRTEWDFLVWLAHESQCDVWVSGLTLNFQPQMNPATAPQYLLTFTPPDYQDTFLPQGNTQDLVIERNMTIAKGITVTVKSFHHGKGKAVTASYPSAPKTVKVGKATPAANAQGYEYHIPGLDQAGALAKAQAIYNEIVKHERKLTANMPADNILSIRNMIRLQNTNTPFDGLYWPSSVKRTMSATSGYAMAVEARTMGPYLAQPGEGASPVSS